MKKSATTLRIELLHVEPMVWRRFVVPSDITLPKLHSVIQLVMGWEDRHLHAFKFAGVEYSLPDDEFPSDAKPEKGVKLSAALGNQREFEYQYDLGDNWVHRIVVERVGTLPQWYSLPLCQAGENACPPEDVGGAGEYENFVEALTDSTHESHADFLMWVGGVFDPDGFDVNAVNWRLRER